MAELVPFTPASPPPVQLTRKTFANVARILASIDEFELAHLDWPKSKRDEFFLDPVRFLMIADRDIEKTAAELWAIVEQRMPRNKPADLAAVLPLFASIPKDMPPDPTAQSEPLTIGQQIVASWETDAIAEPCELAGAIDRAIREAREAADKLAAEVINHDCAPAVLAEREACAQLADEIALRGGVAASSVAAAIRGRA
jgi:hypothetical protein